METILEYVEEVESEILQEMYDDKNPETYMKLHRKGHLKMLEEVRDLVNSGMKKEEFTLFVEKQLEEYVDYLEGKSKKWKKLSGRKKLDLTFFDDKYSLTGGRACELQRIQKVLAII